MTKNQAFEEVHKKRIILYPEASDEDFRRQKERRFGERLVFNAGIEFGKLELQKELGNPSGGWGKTEDGKYHICVGYHPETDEYEWITLVSENSL